MAQGRRQTDRQESLWMATSDLPATAHPFYSKVNEVLDKHGFDKYVDGLTAPFYKDGGRPGIPVGNYFRMMMIGFFEDIGSERGIAWRVADSFSLRHFLGLGLSDATPDHSSLSIIRRRLTEDVHQQAFQFILTILAREGQLRGKTLGIDATTVEASAALRELQRKDTGERYDKYVKRLAEEAGEAASTKEEVARFDRKRKGKKLSNEDWEHPHDPDARIGRDKHNATDMLYKLEKTDDLDTGAIVSVTVQTADTGDTSSADATILAAMDNILAAFEGGRAAVSEPVDAVTEVVVGAGICSEAPEDGQAVESRRIDVALEVVGDKGYHSNETCRFNAETGVRTYFSEPDRGVRNWEGKAEERKAVHANRRRIRGGRGKRLSRLRGEHCERNFAHLCDTGGQRRTFLRGLVNVTKKALIGAMGFNMGLLLRKVFGLRKPRQLGASDGGHLPPFGSTFVSILPDGPIMAVLAEIFPVFTPPSPLTGFGYRKIRAA
jgi:transposase